MDPNVSENKVKILAEIAKLQQQQQQQKQQLKAESNLTSPMDTSGPSRLHDNALLMDGVTSTGGVVAGSSSGVPYNGVRSQGDGVTPVSIAATSKGNSAAQQGTLPSGPRPGFKGVRKPHGQDYYYRQLRRLKRSIKDLIFLNSSACDEIIRVEEKLARVKEERRYLLRKLLQFQSVNEGVSVTAAAAAAAVAAESHATQSSSSGGKSSKSPANHLPTTPDHHHHPPEPAKKSTAKKKTAAGGGGGGGAAGGGGGGGESKKKLPNQAAKDLLESLQAKPKKSKSQSNRKTIPPMQLDSLGRPVFPMMLGDLTLHSIGEIVPDRRAFNSHDCIYPAGFCSTRVFASMTRPHDRCLYTCKISDCGDLPQFEIAPEEGTEVLRGSTPNECHIQLLQAINTALGAEVVSPVGHGADFFGLTNPVIQNLIQSCPGAKKCSAYKWIRFEINKAETNDNVAVGKNDPSISISAFQRLLQQAAGAGKPGAAFSPQTEHSTNLRSLLTKGSVPFSSGSQM